MKRYSDLLYSASALLEKLEGQDKLKTNAKLSLLRKVHNINMTILDFVLIVH